MKGIELSGSTLRSCGYAKAPSFFLAIAAEMRAAGISPLSPYNLSRMNLPGPGELSTPIFFCCFPAQPSEPRIKWTQGHVPPSGKAPLHSGEMAESLRPACLFAALPTRWQAERSLGRRLFLGALQNFSDHESSNAEMLLPLHKALISGSLFGWSRLAFTWCCCHYVPALNSGDLEFFLLHGQVPRQILSPQCFPEVRYGNK